MASSLSAAPFAPNGLIIVSYLIKMLCGGADTRRLPEVAKLHKACLPNTLNSVRGEKTIEHLYRRLLLSGGQIYVALYDERIVGCVAVTMNYFALANFRSVVHGVTSWVHPLMTRGPSFIFGSLLDSLSMSRFLKSSQTQFAYIAAMSVLPEYQSRGIATALLRTAISDLSAHTGRIMIDTERINIGAQRLYQSLQFVMVHSTAKSHIFELQQELD